MQNNTLPPGELAIQSKHGLQMAEHERQFGKLGEPQTPKQKQALKQANAKLKADGFIQPLFKQGEAVPSSYRVGKR